MGLFSSRSSSSVANTYETETNTNQVDQSGNSGLNISQADGVSLTSIENTSTTLNTSDQGAIRAAREIAGDAFGVANSALGLAGQGLDNALASSAGALQFGQSALTNVARVNSDSLDLLTNLIAGAFDNSRTLTRDALAAGAESVKQSITGFGALAKQSSESSDDKVARVAMYAFAAVAALVVLPAIFKR